MNYNKEANICRVCLNGVSDILNPGFKIFDKSCSQLYICQKLNSIANINIKEGDGLPDRICAECFTELERAVNFKEKCETSNGILLSALTLGVPIHDHLEVSIKVESQEDFKFDYYDDATSLPDLKPELDEYKVEKHESFIEIGPPSENFSDAELGIKKSRAIDLKLECNECGGFFKSKCKMRVHWKQAHLQSALTCPSCKMVFKCFKSFQSHQKRKPISCTVATQVRIEGTGRSRVFHCHDCTYHSRRIQDMRSHQVIHTGERPFKCDLCDKTYTQQGSLQAHKDYVHKKIVKEGTCHFCGKTIQGLTKLTRHIKGHQNFMVACKVCNKVFKNQKNLEMHMRRHSGIKSYSCEICPSRFYTIGELGTHRNKVHFKDKSYKCDVCNYTTHNNAAMRKHRSRHSDNNVACDVCGTFVENTLQLMLHRKRHFEKNYSCEQCDKKFFARKNLWSHIKRKHRMVMLVNKPENVKLENN